MTEPVADDRRERARLLYADPSLSVSQVAAQLGVHSSAIHKWARTGNWPRRNENAVVYGGRRLGNVPAGPALKARQPRPDKATRRRKAIVERLYRLFDHNLILMEQTMSDDNPDHPKDPRRELQNVGNLARTFDKLKDLETDQNNRDTAAAPSGRYRASTAKDDDIRGKVIEQILRIRERKRREGGAG